MTYVTVDEANQYAVDRGLCGDITAAALLVASEWLDGRYESRFPGTRTGGRSQPRAFPRDDAYDIDDNPIIGIPDEVKHAVIQAAVREMATPGSLTPDYTPGKQIASATVVGAVAVTYAQAEDADAMLPILSIVEGILYPILMPSGGIGIRLV